MRAKNGCISACSLRIVSLGPGPDMPGAIEGRKEQVLLELDVALDAGEERLAFALQRRPVARARGLARAREDRVDLAVVVHHVVVDRFHLHPFAWFRPASARRACR
jgi:hypothetical protein